MLMTRPTMVIRLGASHSGVLFTRKHHHGCKMGSSRLMLVTEYLWSASRRNWDAPSSFLSRLSPSTILSVHSQVYSNNIVRIAWSSCSTRENRISGKLAIPRPRHCFCSTQARYSDTEGDAHVVTNSKRLPVVLIRVRR